MKKEIKLSVFGKIVIEKAIDFVVSENATSYIPIYKDILKKITFADEIILVYNIKDETKIIEK